MSENDNFFKEDKLDIFPFNGFNCISFTDMYIFDKNHQKVMEATI